METDELRGVNAPLGRQARIAWMRQYVRSRVEQRLSAHEIEQMLDDLSLLSDTGEGAPEAPSGA